MTLSSLCYPNLTSNSSVKYVLTAINYKQSLLLIHLLGAMKLRVETKTARSGDKKLPADKQGLLRPPAAIPSCADDRGEKRPLRACAAL